MHVRQKQCHLEPSHEARCHNESTSIIRSACNDKVIDGSENVFDKTVSRKSVFCATVYMYLEKRSPPLPKIRVMASLLTCPLLERFESRIKQVVGRVCRRSPILFSPQLYVSFEAILQTLPVNLELLSALVYESL